MLLVRWYLEVGFCISVRIHVKKLMLYYAIMCTYLIDFVRVMSSVLQLGIGYIECCNFVFVLYLVE